jgi:hypothetical protein
MTGGATGTAPAQDCNDRCCKEVLGGSVCEPVCKSSCEAEKAARGGGVPVPDIGPSKSWELGQKLLTMSCAAGFETVMKPAILNTGFEATGGDRYINTYEQSSSMRALFLLRNSMVFRSAGASMVQRDLCQTETWCA